MKSRGLGIDILEIKRFNSFRKNRNSRFLLNNYSKKEIDYCFSFKNPAPHLAGAFAAKEAVFKTLGRNDIVFSSIEIRRNKNGKPEVWIKNRRQKLILISISHTTKIAIAIAIKQ